MSDKQAKKQRTPEEKAATARRWAENLNALLFLAGFTSMTTGLIMVSLELGLIVSGAVALGLSLTWVWRRAR